MMHLHQFCVINYIDDFVGVPDVAERSFECLYALLECLGLTISKKKLIPPTTEPVCLGVLVNTITGTISIPEEKLTQIVQTVKEWKTKVNRTKHELQSLLGQLLYIHKCVRPARVFLNRMLDVLHRNYDKRVITLTQRFRRDLRWFDKFSLCFNGMSMYAHKRSDYSAELDACLDGLGSVWNNYVYHIPITRGHMQWTIVHLEMINILIALCAFAAHWAGKSMLIKCDNQAVVNVLTHKTRDAFLGACAHNVWQVAALHDIDLTHVHIMGKDNDLLSRWTGSYLDIQKLNHLVCGPLWLQLDENIMHVNYEI